MTKNIDLTKLIIEGIQEKKGRDIVTVDLAEVDGAAANKFIIAQGNTNMQVTAIADSIREYVQEKSSVKPYNYDGYRNAQWIVIDYGDILVHIFTPETRSYYNLEELWSDATLETIPNLD